MKKLILQLLSIAMMLGMCLTTFAQHLTSPIFLRELVHTDTVPATWQLRQQFSIEKSPSAHQCLPCNESIITKL